MPTEEGDLERLAVAHVSLVTACCLFVLDSRLSEQKMSYLLADHADPQRLGDVSGKYVKRAIGYIQIFENGNARALDELPEGVSSDEVVVDELDVSNATPLQDRLRAILSSLRNGPQQGAEVEALVEAIEASLEAYRPGSEGRCLEQIREWARSEVFDADGPGDVAHMTECGYKFFDHLGRYAKELQDGMLGDGMTIGGVLATRALVLARAARAQDPDDEMDALIESLVYLTAGGPGRIEPVAMGLCGRMIRHGHRDAVREAAEGLKSEGDALIAEALDGDMLTFYASIYPAAAYELAVVHIGRAAAGESVDPEEKRRWGRLAVNAEERAVRVATSLGFALMNLDGSWIGRHQMWLRQVRDEEGDDAARLKAQDLISNQLFYPKAMTPVLLGELDPATIGSDDRQ